VSSIAAAAADNVLARSLNVSKGYIQRLLVRSEMMPE
jgi:hypothetical protein